MGYPLKFKKHAKVTKTKKETMSAGLEPTTFGEFQCKPKTNALPLRQDTCSNF